MSSNNGSGPWKIASNSASSSKQADTRSFPPLSSKSQTKRQSRLRALYTQTPHFNPYTPRRDQINRQELERLQLDHPEDHYGIPLGAASGAEEGILPPTSIQHGGVSSISIKGFSERRLDRGFDRTRRASTYRKMGIASSRCDDLSGMKDDLPVDLPTPFNDAKLEGLLSECRRRQRARAADQRQRADGATDADPLRPLTGELKKAFASLDGFLAGFGIDSEGKTSTEIIETVE